MVKEEVSCAVVEWITQTGGTSSVTWDPREPGAMTDRGARLAVLVADVCRDGSKSC